MASSIQRTLNAELEAGKYTRESVANAKLSTELEHRLWIILVGDRVLGPKFHKLLVERRTSEERLKWIERVHSTRLTLYSWVRGVIGVVAEENLALAEQFAAVLKKNPGSNTLGGRAEPRLSVSQHYFDRDRSIENIGQKLADCGELLAHETWIDEYGLPLPLDSGGDPVHDGMNKQCLLGDRKEAEARLAFLSRHYDAHVMRWNPCDNSTRSETGWIVLQDYGSPLMLSRDHLRILQMNPQLMQDLMRPSVLADACQ